MTLLVSEHARGVAQIPVERPHQRLNLGLLLCVRVTLALGLAGSVLIHFWPYWHL